MKTPLRLLVPAFFALAVASCGGGGGTDTDTPVSGDLAALDLAYDGAVPPEDAVGDTVEGDVVLPDGGVDVVPCEPGTDGTFSLACPGLVTDSRNGLVWQARAEYQGWADARAACESLTLAGHEDWRLPTVDDHRAMLAGCAKTGTGGLCGVTVECWRMNCASDTSCFWGCGKSNGPGANACYLSGLLEQPCQTYWSSTQAEKDGMGTARAWVVSYLDAAISVAPVSGDAWYRCVRGP